MSRPVDHGCRNGAYTPPGVNSDDTSICSGPHGPCGVGAVRITTSFIRLQYSARYCLRWLLYCTDISPTGPGITGVAAAGLAGTQELESALKYSYLLRSGTTAGATRATYADPLRPLGVPKEYR